MARYRKKPVEIEALYFDGSHETGLAEWCGGRLVPMGNGFWKIAIPTLEGELTASPGDYVIRGVRGEHYACKPGIFEETYDRVDDDEG